ncbi:heme o synthase [Halocola ammonii]
MKTTETIVQDRSASSSKVKDIAMLFKLRLTVLVVISAALGYLMAVPQVHWTSLILLCLGGVLLTGASNSFNQVWEKDNDRLMDRTSNRPLPAGRMSVVEALVYGTIAGIAGIAILWYFLNPLSGVLGALSLFVYVFVYTPMKQHTSLAVFAGAFPGAVPPMLGYVAGSGTFGLEPGILFAVQFMWQFPHFWAIAWVAEKDYAKVNYKLLPFKEGRSKRSAFQILLYSLFLLPVGLLPWAFPQGDPMVGNIAMVTVVVCTLLFIYQAFKLYRTCAVQDAKKLMFASFFYLPIVQIIYVIDKL